MAGSGLGGTAEGVQPVVHARPKQTRPIRKLVMGPAIPIQNSVPGSADSFSISDTPPSANSVIELTGKPRAFATAACDNSCRRIDAKKSRAVIIAMTQMTGAPHVGLTAWN